MCSTIKQNCLMTHKKNVKVFKCDVCSIGAFIRALNLYCNSGIPSMSQLIIIYSPEPWPIQENENIQQIYWGLRQRRWALVHTAWPWLRKLLCCTCRLNLEAEHLRHKYLQWFITVDIVFQNAHYTFYCCNWSYDHKNTVALDFDIITLTTFPFK